MSLLGSRPASTDPRVIAATNAGFATETRWFEEGEFERMIDERPVARIRLMSAAGAASTSACLRSFPPAAS